MKTIKTIFFGIIVSLSVSAYAGHSADGDINLDGQVNSVDVLYGFQTLIGQRTLDSSQLNNADLAPLVNGVSQSDGQFTLGDQVLVLRKALDPCLSNGSNSVDNDTRIHSEREGCAVLKRIANVRPGVSVDYMMHTAVGTTKAVVLLIAGGSLNAKLEGTVGSRPTNASGNFLVRSAHLFADLGYRVLTITRPTDYTNYSSKFDDYRTSSNHGIDIAAIINAENSESLPVLIVGTSRGAISAVSHFQLALAISIPSPVTSGDGTPVIAGSFVDPQLVTVPVQVLWNTLDTCGVSKPVDSATLVADFIAAPPANTATGNALTGGFTRAGHTVCKGQTPHGFMGIEVEAVKTITDFLDSNL